MATKGAQLCLRKQWLFEVAFFPAQKPLPWPGEGVREEAVKTFDVQEAGHQGPDHFLPREVPFQWSMLSPWALFKKINDPVWNLISS